MWLLKLQYEFYNLRFYDTERNFSHQGQRQEKWDRISEMGSGRGKRWGWGFQNDKDSQQSQFPDVYFSPQALGTDCRMSHLQHSAAQRQVPTATEVGLNHFPSFQPHFQSPHPKSHFPGK